MCLIFLQYKLKSRSNYLPWCLTSKHKDLFQRKLFLAGKMTVFCAIFLLNKDISQLRYELGHIHEKILFYEESTFFMSQLHNFISKYLSIVQFFMCVPKYLTIVQFLPNLCLTFPARLFWLGPRLVIMNHITQSSTFDHLITRPLFYVKNRSIPLV